VKTSIRFSLLSLCLITATHPTSFALPAPEHYEPTHTSISQHPLPEWYEDAKFGIFVHYGLYTIPAWAELADPTGKVFTPEFFLHNPYSAWYMNSIKLKESPAYEHHVKTYGADFNYDNFRAPFNQAAAQWQPDNWSDLFEKSGAKYVVLTTKHHDGFLLWPSLHQNPYKSEYVAKRDIVGEFTRSVRSHHMHVGLYYSGGYDWSWQEGIDDPITDLNSAIMKVPQTEGYAEYVTQHWNELIDTYHPDLLWNDIALPKKVDREKLFAHYYNTVPEGVVNNRWAQSDFDYSYMGQPQDELIDKQLEKDWFDYYSPEYLPAYVQTRHKWEADHAPGYDFSYNTVEYENPAHFFSLDQLVCDLVDIVSKNGNLILAIGPEADGTIPDIEKNLLLGIGEWLNKNGEAIYATRPWVHAEGTANNKTIPVRFTQSKNHQALYALLLKNPAGQHIVLKNVRVLDKKTRIEIINGDAPIVVHWRQLEDKLVILTGENNAIPQAHALAVKITPLPNYVADQ
jgi:alpha-L-fucosidase